MKIHRHTGGRHWRRGIEPPRSDPRTYPPMEYERESHLRRIRAVNEAHAAWEQRYVPAMKGKT